MRFCSRENKTMINNDTICAVSSPPGVGAVGIIRISGKASIDILNTVFQSKTPFSHALMRHGFIVDGRETVDEVMAVGFESERTYTGEPTAEVYPHGGHMPMMRVETTCPILEATMPITPRCHSSQPRMSSLYFLFKLFFFIRPIACFSIFSSIF